MAEYIERVEIIKYIEKKLDKLTDMPEMGARIAAMGSAYNSTLNYIMQIPAVEVEPVKYGEWISMLVKRPDWKGNMQSYYQPNTCSECHIGLAEKTNYCPNCGAKMDGKEVQE